MIINETYTIRIISSDNPANFITTLEILDTSICDVVHDGYNITISTKDVLGETTLVVEDFEGGNVHVPIVVDNIVYSYDISYDNKIINNDNPAIIYYNTDSTTQYLNINEHKFSTLYNRFLTDADNFLSSPFYVNCQYNHLNDGITLTHELNTLKVDLLSAYSETQVSVSITSSDNTLTVLDIPIYVIDGDLLGIFPSGNLGTSSKDVFVKAENVAPVITVVSTLTVDEDSSTEIPVTISDTDGSITGVTVTADNGITTYNTDTNIINYAPNADFNGSDTIRITATDDLNANTVINIAVTVTSINDISVLTLTESVTTDEDTIVEIPFSVSDIDGTVVSVTASATHGTATVDTNNGTITYTPELNFNGGDTIVVTSTDNDNAVTVKNVAVVVNSINDNPIINISDTTTSEDTAVNIPYTASDIEGGIVITTVGTNGTAVVDLENSQVIFTPDNNFVGAASFDITITDSEDAAITKTVNVNVTTINDNPIITIGTVFSMDENTDKVISYTVSDIDGVVESVTASDTPNATITVDSVAQTITYTPNVEFTGEDTFTVTATDNEGGTDSKIITITVNNVDVAATITVDANVTVDEDSSVVIPFTISDIDGNVVATASALNGTTIIDSNNITYTPNTNFNGTDTITLTSTDIQGGVTTASIVVTINPINDSSVVTVQDTLVVTTDSLTDISYNTTDVDGDNLTISVTNSGTGSVSINTTIKTISYDAPSITGTDTITLTVNDGTVDTIKTIAVTIN